MDKIREEFEAFVINRMKESGFLEVEVRVEMLGVSSDGSYFDGTVDAWWDFWKASRYAMCVELPDGSYCGFEGDSFHAYMCGVESCKDILDEAGVKYK